MLTFDTTTAGLRALRDWLTAHAVTHVAMESTGVYWRPVSDGSHLFAAETTK